MSSELPPVLDVAETARVLKTSPHTIYSLIRSGRLRALRLGQRSWRITSADLERFLEADQAPERQP